MKTLIMFLIIFSTSYSFAQEDLAADDLDCHDCLSAEAQGFELPSAFDELYNVTRAERVSFIARNHDLAGWTIPLRIVSNFKVPLVGSQNYFGRIYFRRGENFIQYRDEQIARRNYDEERRNPRLFMASKYTMAEINARGGYGLAPSVRLIGQQFNTTSGGQLTIAVNGMRVTFNVAVNGNRATPSVTVGGRRITFDTMKINARGESVLRGLQNVQLIQNGRVVHTITN